MKTELEKFSDQMALMEMCVQLEDEQKKIFDALPKLKDEFSKEAKAEFARLTKQAEAIEWKLAEARGEYLKTVEANRDEFARIEQSIKAKGFELAEYSKRLQYEVPPPVEQKIKAIFETLPRPANGKDGADGKDASLLTGFRGNWDSDTTYKAGDWFTFRGSSYLVLRACKGQIPTKNAQGEPNAYYAVFAMSGAPGITPEGLYLPVGGGAMTGPLAVGGSTNAYDQFRAQRSYTLLPDNNTQGNFAVFIASGPSGADTHLFRAQLNYATVNGATYGLAEMVGGFDKISNDITNAAKSVTLLKGRLITVRSGSAGTTGTAIGVEVLPYITGAGSWTSWSGFKSTSPILSSSGTLGTAYGCYIEKQKVTGVTTGYGIYQADAADINYFAGAIAIGNTVAAGVAVASTHKVTISIGGNTYYLLASNV